MSLSKRFGAIKSVAVDSTEDETDMEDNGLLRSFLHKKHFKYSQPDAVFFTSSRTENTELDSCDEDNDSEDLEQFDPEWLDDFKTIIKDSVKSESSHSETTTSHKITGRTSPLFKKIARESPDLPLQSLKNTLSRYSQLTNDETQKVKCKQELFRDQENITPVSQDVQKEISVKNEDNEKTVECVKPGTIVTDAEERNVELDPDQSDKKIDKMSKILKMHEDMEIKEMTECNLSKSLEQCTTHPLPNHLAETKSEEIDSQKQMFNGSCEFSNTNAEAADSQVEDLEKPKLTASTVVASVAIPPSLVSTGMPSNTSTDKRQKGSATENVRPVEEKATAAVKSTSSKTDRNPEARKHKVMSINEAKSFPLDEILPVKKRKLSGDILGTDKPVKPEDTSDTLGKTIETVVQEPIYESYFTSTADLYSHQAIDGSYQPVKVFHGTVYQSDTQNAAPLWLDNPDQTFYTTASMTQHPLLPGALESNSDYFEQNHWLMSSTFQQTNHHWTQPYQNILSQQTAFELQDFASRVNISSYMHPTADQSFNGFVSFESPHARVCENAVTYEDIQSVQGGQNCEGDKEKLSDLIDKLQQCIAIVESETDREELVSLIDVLKRETENVAVCSGFTPAGEYADTACKSAIVKPINHTNDAFGSGQNSSCRSPVEVSNSHEGKLEFEGRTMLKGGVEPRHIPRKIVEKLDKARPKDPRPFHKARGHGSLKLPPFMWEVWGEDIVDKILAHDWGPRFERRCNMEVYCKSKKMEEERYYNPQKEINKTKKTMLQHHTVQEKLITPRLDGKETNGASQFQSGKTESGLNGSACEQPIHALSNKHGANIYTCNSSNVQCDFILSHCLDVGGCHYSVADPQTSDGCLDKSFSTTKHTTASNSVEDIRQQPIKVVIRSSHETKKSKPSVCHKNLHEIKPTNEVSIQQKTIAQGPCFLNDLKTIPLLESDLPLNLRGTEKVKRMLENDLKQQRQNAHQKADKYLAADREKNLGCEVLKGKEAIEIVRSKVNNQDTERKKNISKIKQDERRVKSVVSSYEDDFGQSVTKRDTTKVGDFRREVERRKYRERSREKEKISDSHERKESGREQHKSKDKSDHRSKIFKKRERSKSSERGIFFSKEQNRGDTNLIRKQTKSHSESSQNVETSKNLIDRTEIIDNKQSVNADANSRGRSRLTETAKLKDASLLYSSSRDRSGSRHESDRKSQKDAPSQDLRCRLSKPNSRQASPQSEDKRLKELDKVGSVSDIHHALLTENVDILDIDSEEEKEYAREFREIYASKTENKACSPDHCVTAQDNLQQVNQENMMGHCTRVPTQMNVDMDIQLGSSAQTQQVEVPSRSSQVSAIASKVGKATETADKSFLQNLRQKIFGAKETGAHCSTKVKESLNQDKEFLASLKEKLVGNKTPVGCVLMPSEQAKKQLTNLDLELKDRAYLAMCRKKKEEKLKHFK